jgi:uncharacterized peroxidase-related enzyme
MPLFPSLPENAPVTEVWRRWPESASFMPKVSESIMRGPSPLTPGERELIAAYSSANNDCRYCFGVHSQTAHAFGIEEGLFEKLMQDPDTAPVAEKMKPMLAFVKKLTLTPSRMTQRDADAVFEAGWDEDALHDAVMVCALFNFMNRVVEGHGILLAPDELRARGIMIKEQGYDRPGRKEAVPENTDIN